MSDEALEKLRAVARENATLREQFRVVSHLGMRLATALEPDQLLPEIVTAARQFTGAEGGSLYVREGDELAFAVAQNDRLEEGAAATLKGLRLRLDGESLAGLAARENRTLNIEDAASHPSHGTEARDAVGYQVKSMLVVPLADDRGEVQGVLQLLNALDESGEAVPFSEQAAYLSGVLASHAATAMRIAGLYQELSEVFQSLVRYTTAAIDARDACTAGHSSRVGALALALGREMGSFDDQELKELRIAGLFHDVGKIGVREPVLTKSDKLTPPEMEVVRQRFSAAAAAWVAEASLGDAARTDAVERARARAGTLVDELAFIESINVPGLLRDEDVDRLGELAATTFRTWAGAEQPLLTADELEKLSVRRGNLTDAERADIQSHVVHSYRFLRKIPFPASLARVPEIVYSHHEKMDGSGYPRGLAGEEILLQARILAVVDVFDALTAADRPYKKAMSALRATEVIEAETRAGAWDPDVVAALRRLAESGRLVSRRRELQGAEPPGEDEAWT